MTARRLSLFSIALLAALPLLAGGLSEKYKNWPNSPQGYFMTAAEREAWKMIATDQAAEAFVKEYLAKRGGDAFVAEVADLAAQADKYLTVGGTAGSTTLRGKMVILLGPPASITAAKKKSRGDFRSTANGYMDAASMDGRGTSVGEVASVAQQGGMSEKIVAEYTYTYPADKLPAAYRKPLTVKIEVDADGHDRIELYSTKQELETLYEMVAQSRIAAAQQAAPAQ